MTDPYRTFRGLPASFHQAYFDWHSSGQYEGVREFDCVGDVVRRPPKRERDDWYSDECNVIDRSFRTLSDSRVLEIGCGDGNLTWKLATRCAALRSCDMDPGAVALTARRLAALGISNVDVRQGAAQEMQGGNYDVVFFVQVLEHVPGWQQGPLFDHVFDLVAPGGCLFVSTPNRWTIRDVHDTGRLFIHWWPRWIRVPVARRLNWGVASHDPAWPYPPVLHDYVSFRWMWRRARRAHSQVEASRMSFYPTAEAWFAAKERQPSGTLKRAGRRVLRHAGRLAPAQLLLWREGDLLEARAVMRCTVLLPDGRSVRNFVLGGFLARWESAGGEAMALHTMPDHVLTQYAGTHNGRVRYGALHPYREGALASTLRYSLAYGQMWWGDTQAMRRNRTRAVNGSWRTRTMHGLARLAGRAAAATDQLRTLDRLHCGLVRRAPQVERYQRLFADVRPSVHPLRAPPSARRAAAGPRRARLGYHDGDLHLQLGQPDEQRQDCCAVRSLPRLE